ncbi:MAG: DNA-directed RNA polymerase subunit beta' [bacterium]
MSSMVTSELRTPSVSKKRRKDELNYAEFDAMRVGLASPEKIRGWSYGEVKKPETINYRTLKPERDGLFCERIFGPTKDYECACEKYRWVKFKGITCDRCGVEITESRVRRERMGHIELAVPIAHIWFLRKSPSRIGIVLDMKTSDLERVVYYACYAVLEDLVDPVTNRAEYRAKDILTDAQVKEARKKFSKIKVGIGAGAIRQLLEKMDMKNEVARIHEDLAATHADVERSKLIRRLRLLEGFIEGGNKPEWMILTVLPVIPPDLRPLVPLEGGRFATSDLNDLYRRIINRNNRLKHIEALRAPEVMIYNEKRLLQEAVDALIENGARGKVVLGAGNRPLKSLSDILKGKQGRFRQNLLGKRVDYSGRSVIVVGPNLKLHQCGLPKEMALELFKPFIIRELMKKDSLTLKAAKRMLERASTEIWDILEQVTRHHPVMLNRAPTLHRLGIQAFEPVLIEGMSIQLHPLTCAAFNADFDGDQMAVHVPLSQEAQLEARMLMMATNNLLSPSSGRPIATPSHDMVLGINYLTKVKSGERGEGGIFADADEAVSAYEHGKLDLHARIKVLGINAVGTDSSDREIKSPAEWKDYTTVGRVIFNQTLPPGLKFINQAIGKKDMSNLVDGCYKDPKIGHYETVLLLDKLMRLGYRYATKAGSSISISDMVIPNGKWALIEKAKSKVKEIEKHSQAGVITEGERYNKIIDLWTKATDTIADEMFKEMEGQDLRPYSRDQHRFNSIAMMANSGARGSRAQVRQLAGMRGLMAKPQKKLTGGAGEIIESPIFSNFREGLTVLEYFISTHGGRKGLSDTALKTADAGYLTRRLVDVSHNVVVMENDCGTINGVNMKPLMSGEEVIEALEERIAGRVALDDVKIAGKDGKNKPLIKAGEMITVDQAKAAVKAGVENVKVRSVLTCEARFGVCAKCYGINLATGVMTEVGEAVGIIAAQSIGEPGTQLTLRTFHIGGTASRVAGRSQAQAKSDGKVVYKDIRLVTNQAGEEICVSRGAVIAAQHTDGNIDEHRIAYGAKVKFDKGAKVRIGEIMAEWDPHFMPIITEYEGAIRLLDVKEGVTMHQERDKNTGIIERRIVEHRESLKNPRIVVEKSGKMMASYPLPTDTILLAETGQKVKTGYVLAKIPQESGGTKDITGGLPRVSELFEARRPRNTAVVSKIEGVVSLGTSAKGLAEVSVRNEETGQVEPYPIPQGKHLQVYDGDKVGVGETLTDGAANPHDILSVKGVQSVQEHLLNGIQEVYRLQGVGLNDKHIEVIVRQMLDNVKILDSGGTSFLKGEIINRAVFRNENEKMAASGHASAQAEPVLLGISKASLASESFISAASFQETTRVLTDAATSAQIDSLRGLKENVIIGHLIPAGTGLAGRNLLESKNKEE